MLYLLFCIIWLVFTFAKITISYGYTGNGLIKKGKKSFIDYHAFYKFLFNPLINDNLVIISYNYYINHIIFTCSIAFEQILLFIEL